jgi:hypothetical protein
MRRDPHGVENRTILDMITSGGPDRAQGRPVTVGKGALSHFRWWQNVLM